MSLVDSALKSANKLVDEMGNCGVDPVLRVRSRPTQD
jgi:hypothetical protein